MRLKQFARLRDLGPLAVFRTAMLKPLIGVLLAIVILATLSANVLSFANMDLSAATIYPASGETAIGTLYLLWLISPLSGFIKRLA